MSDRIDFFIAGVQKGGTTALDALLRRHPAIEMGRTKEIHHFDDETIDWRAPDHARLHAQFDWSRRAVVRGEATPIYIYWPAALERIRAYHPDAKLIVGLRHPSLRAFSHWKMETARGWEDQSFADAIRVGRRRVGTAPGGAHRVHSFVERGFYDRQLQRLLQLFPRRNLHVFRTDALWLDPRATLEAIETFLGVERRLDPVRTYIAPEASAPDTVGLAPADRAYLDDLYRPHIAAVATLAGIDLSDWMSPGYAEPMRREPA